MTDAAGSAVRIYVDLADAYSLPVLADAIAAAGLSHGVRLELVRGNQMGYLDLQK